MVTINQLAEYLSREIENKGKSKKTVLILNPLPVVQIIKKLSHGTSGNCR